MRVEIRINPKKVFTRVSSAALLALGVLRIWQAPENTLIVIVTLISGFYALWIIENDDYIGEEAGTEQLEELTEIIWENSEELSVKDARECAEYQLKGKSNTDYKVLCEDELDPGMYFALFKSIGENDMENWITTMLFVEPDDIYIYDNENKKLTVNKDIQLIAVDMNSFVDDEKVVSTWKEKYKTEEKHSRDK